MLTVSPAKPSDCLAIAELMAELDRHYGATDSEPVDRRSATISNELFGANAVARVLLAHQDRDNLVGFAAYSFLWPAAGVTRSLFLKELYVRAMHRDQGVGRALMKAICVTAADNGCSRVEWTTEQANTDAVGFYASLGAAPTPEKIFYRIDEADLLRLAQR